MFEDGVWRMVGGYYGRETRNLVGCLLYNDLTRVSQPRTTQLQTVDSQRYFWHSTELHPTETRICMDTTDFLSPTSIQAHCLRAVGPEWRVRNTNNIDD